MDVCDGVYMLGHKLPLEGLEGSKCSNLLVGLHPGSWEGCISLRSFPGLLVVARVLSPYTPAPPTAVRQVLGAWCLEASWQSRTPPGTPCQTQRALG